MPTVSWKLPPPSHGDNSTTSADNWKVPPLTRGDSSMEKTPTDWKVRSEFDDSDDNPFDDNNSFDDDNSLVHDDDLTTQADNWKVSPSALGDSSTKKTPTDWKVRSAFDDDDDNSTTPANNWKVPPLTLGDSSTKKIPTDWKVRSTFDDDDDNSTIPANNWKVPSSTLGDSSTKKTPTDWKVRSTFDDDDDDSTTPAGNWKIPPSTLGDTKKTPTDWKNRSSFNGYSKKATTTDSWKLPPLIEDDGSSRTTSADNPEVFPSVHDNDSMETMPTYTPYLQLPHLLSLAWITYPVISLILVAFRLQLSLASAENGLDNLKNDILASCTAAEKASTAAASMPRYLAQTSNQQFADAANGVMSDAQSALILSLTILEGTLNFVIDMYRSTFLCLLELVVGVGLSLVTDAVQVVCNLSLFLYYTNASLARHFCCKHRK
jgi:hypothetical protein